MFTPEIHISPIRDQDAKFSEIHHANTHTHTQSLVLMGEPSRQPSRTIFFTPSQRSTICSIDVLSSSLEKILTRTRCACHDNEARSTCVHMWKSALWQTPTACSGNYTHTKAWPVSTTPLDYYSCTRDHLVSILLLVWEQPHVVGGW